MWKDAMIRGEVVKGGFAAGLYVEGWYVGVVWWLCWEGGLCVGNEGYRGHLFCGDGVMAG